MKKEINKIIKKSVEAANVEQGKIMRGENMSKSKCCGAEAIDHLSIRYPDKTDEELRGKTNYYICQKCQEGCDIIEE